MGTATRSRPRVVAFVTTLLLASTGLLSASPVGAADCDPGEFSISGTVTDAATGLPLTVVTSVGFGSFDNQNTVLPGSTYSICLPAGTYTVNFFADGYFLEWHDDAATLADATPVTGAAGEHLVVDAALTSFPVITGRVTDARTGAPLFTSVGLADATGVGLDGEGTDANGVYRFVIDPNFYPIPGSYLVNFSADFHWSEWYDDAKKRSKATVIEVTRDSGVISGIDAELRPCGRPVPDFCIPNNFGS